MLSQPRFILSKKAVLDNYTTLKSISDKISYSFKTNKEVGLILKEKTDCDFSIHAITSIDKISSPERIWFFAQGWDSEEITIILQKKVRRFVVDNINDLTILLQTIDKNKDNIDLLLRMKLKENTIHTGKHFVYGMYSHQIKKVLPKLYDNPSIRKLGIHFHRKTQNISEWSLKYELESIFSQQHLHMMDYINIGGGLPGNYKNFRADTIESIFSKIKDLRSWLNNHNITMIIEPGRFIAAPSIRLECQIVNIYDNNIIINASIFSGAMDTFVSNIRLLIKEELPDGQGTPYTIKGKTPDSMDIFRYRAFLNNPKVGDTLTFLNAGAYTYSTDFCGLQPIKIIYEE